MEVLPLDKQKKVLLYAPKDLLWALLEEESSWLKILSVLSKEYFADFLATLKRSGITGDSPENVKAHAKMFVKSKVRQDHLQKALYTVWNPVDLEESTSWLKSKNFLGRPLMPLNIQATRKAIKEAKALPRATSARMLRAAKGKPPRAGHPPDNASTSGSIMWNRVMHCPDRRKIILKPKSVQTQWALAHKLWISECTRSRCKPYQSDSGSTFSSPNSVYAHNLIIKAFGNMHEGLCQDGYSMSRPAARTLKKLRDQLEKDGVPVGRWSSIRPKRKK